jgi:hypothetical protein
MGFFLLNRRFFYYTPGFKIFIHLGFFVKTREKSGSKIQDSSIRTFPATSLMYASPAK